MTENGPDIYDEINLVEPGFNSGWRQIMGPDARGPQGAGNLFAVPGSLYRDPRFSSLGPMGVTGIAFLGNDAFVGDILNGRLYRFRLNGGRDGFALSSPGLADLVADSDPELDEVILGIGFGGITDIKARPGGILYFFAGKHRRRLLHPHGHLRRRLLRLRRHEHWPLTGTAREARHGTIVDPASIGLRFAPLASGPSPRGEGPRSTVEGTTGRPRRVA